MSANWKLFYKENDAGEMQFAELLSRDGDSSVRKGAAFTHGTVDKIDSFDSTSAQLLEQGYQLRREWNFDRNARDYDLFGSEIRAVIATAPNFSDSNALAIVTDSSFMTVGFALHKFDDIESTADEELWIVDEWGAWNTDWRLDPAYRWLLAYGHHDHFDEDLHHEFCERVRKVFLDVLKSFADTKDILLIYVGGDDVGHRWSAECMDEKLAERMLDWI
ncbi:MAG TPA: hypothetical protein VGM98_05050 [Schlesneria sp.]|jgi:hypothetical protein